MLEEHAVRPDSDETVSASNPVKSGSKKHSPSCEGRESLSLRRQHAFGARHTGLPGIDLHSHP